MTDWRTLSAWQIARRETIAARLGMRVVFEPDGRIRWVSV